MSDAPKRLLVDCKALGLMLDVSVRQVSRLSDAGGLPMPLALGGCKRWSIEEIEAWVRAGCPSRDDWENLQSGSSPDRGPVAGH